MRIKLLKLLIMFFKGLSILHSDPSLIQNIRLRNVFSNTVRLIFKSLKFNEDKIVAAVNLDF